MVNFNHEAREISKSLNIDEKRSTQLDAMLIYNIINQEMMVRNLFDDQEEAPINLRTKTGLLERCFENTKCEEERVYLVWEYAKLDMRLKDDNKLQAVMTGMAMLYEVVNGDEQAFIKKFVSFRDKAKDMNEDNDE